MLMLLCGIGIACVGIWFAVTGSLPVGIVIAAIGATVVAVIQGAQMVCLAIKTDAATLSTDIEALTREHGSLAGSLSEIEGTLSHLAAEVAENGKYIAAAILAAPAARGVIDEPAVVASPASARPAPPYVAMSGAEIAAEVLRQRLLGNSHDRSVAHVATQFERPETLIYEAWRDNWLSALNLVV